MGAKERGKPLPDALTAFPFNMSSYGCFATDLKFSERSKVRLGGEDKNKRYITDGRNNETIKRNGGLKGYIFISNAHAPGNFIPKFTRLAKKFRSLKISYIEVPHLMAIYNHYKDYEDIILSNSSVKEIFLKLMDTLLFVKKPKKHAVIVDIDELNTLIKEAVEKYGEVTTPRVTS